MTTIRQHHTQTPINHFSGEHSFLHNDFPCRLKVDGVRYFCVTHAWLTLAMRYEITKQKLRQLTDVASVYAVAAGKSRRDDWHFVRDEFLRVLLCKKFKATSLKRQLLATGDKSLIFGNSDGNRYLGVDCGVGRNVLGKLLMELRDAARS